MRKESVLNFGQPNLTERTSYFYEFMLSLPLTGFSKDIIRAINTITIAKENGKKVVLGIGGHVIKRGLGHIIVDLIENKFIDAVIMNGAAMIHDVEFSIYGTTSEDVDMSLPNSTFGFDEQATELCYLINRSVEKAYHEKEFGERVSLGETMKGLAEEGDYKGYSILANSKAIDVSIHIAFGTDINHMHPDFNAEAWGEATYTDFDKLCGIVNSIKGGVYINMGSAVILPEVFMKAVARGRAYSKDISDFTTIVIDFQNQYRPRKNVIERMTDKGIYLVGPHEIILPIIAWSLKEGIRKDNKNAPS